MRRKLKRVRMIARQHRTRIRNTRRKIKGRLRKEAFRKAMASGAAAG